ncbi:nucleophile aminohydrolase [Corynascus novoguineensis]|uniref:Nucleophile aminohydrolase n=1 Tax=Corynascus novoguineensis TaxID=1126955 RepID=A0AAN7CNJ4_9PEZI|nr:nucleophile aminohydrolase [Corynascus novoguineensis]
MEYKRQEPSPPRVQPRLIIHGGAGNITPATLTPERYAKFRTALLTIISKAHAYMTTPSATSLDGHTTSGLPSALFVATRAVSLLEDDPLFNAGRGAVFTRDGINELEASVMVSRGYAKRAVAVSGLRRVRNPILLAREVLRHGEADLQPSLAVSQLKSRLALGGADPAAAAAHSPSPSDVQLDVPSAQGHTHVHGAAAEQLAEQYGLALVDEGYFWTKRRWEEHLRGLEREKREGGGLTATWSKTEYVPQGTVGAVAVDEEGVVCVATSTGGLTNKLTGRIGDTPTVGAGFWAEEWIERGRSGAEWRKQPAVVLSGALKAVMADCLPTPWVYTPLSTGVGELVTTRSVAVSGTGNGDSFLRTAAARTVGSIARFAGDTSRAAVTKIIGPGGEVQRSAGDRWGKTGEGEGGMIGIECVVVRNAEGGVIEVRSELLQDYNCAGMFRAWIDERGVAIARVFREGEELPDSYAGEGRPENPRAWSGEKLDSI